MKNITVSDALRKLEGMTDQEIAEFLKRNRVRGKRGCEGQCPLAKWLQRETGRQIDVMKQGWITGDANGPVQASKTVSKFVNKFDRGDWPFLLNKKDLLEWKIKKSKKS